MIVQTLVRVVAGLVGAATVPMAAYSGWAALAGVADPAMPAPTRVYFATLALAGFVAGFLAAAVAARGPREPVIAAFSVFLAGYGVAAMDEGRFRLILRLAGDGRPAWVDDALLYLFFAAVAAAVAAAIRITQLFPRPLTASEVQATPGPRALRAVQVRLLGAAPTWLGFGVLGWLLLVGTNRWLPGLIVPVVILFLLLELVVGVLYFRVSYARGDEEDRDRVFWFLESGVVAAATLLVGFWVELAVHVLDVGGPVIRWLHALLIPLGILAAVVIIAFAIFHRGALDARLVVRRTVVYGLVGFVLTLLFVGVETLVEQLLAGRLGLPATAGSYAAGIIAALLFGPLREAIDKRLPVQGEPEGR